MKYDDNDFNLYYDELTTTNSYTSELFKYGWQNEIKDLERKLERYKYFDNAITQRLEDRGFITYEEYECLCDWLYNSTVEPDKILIAVFGRQP